MRSRIHDDIQRLHGTMPLWGVDHWVPLGDLFVDVNILEQVSSNRRLELDDLWQDFAKGNFNYRSLDRIGLGEEQQRVPGLLVLERNTNLIVVGKPGSGKTTYLQRIVTECNAGRLQAQQIPVLIKLREFVDDGHKYTYSLEQFLRQLWQLNNADIELVLNQGRALVLLDGLDEVTGETGKQIVKNIKQFARVYPQVRLVVSCRTQTLTDLFDWISNRFTCVEVADFDEEQVRVFAAHWFETVCMDAEKGETKTREFLEQLFREENKPIRELAITPILLSLTCAVFHQTGKFYSKRSKLYQEGLELLLEQWDERRGIERDEIYRDLSVERKLEMLSYLAMKKCEQENYVLFKQQELEAYISEFLKIEQRDSQKILNAIESQHGLLIKRAEKVWSFSHLTFQEYLVALYIVKNNNLPVASQYLVDSIHKAQWQSIFLTAIEMISDPDTLIKYLKQKIDSLLATNEKLQSYLKWLLIKSQSIIDLYKPAAIRYFYFILSNNIAPLGNNEFLLLNSSTTSAWHYNIGIDKNMIVSLAGNYDPDVAFDQNLASCLDQTIELNLDRSLIRILHKFIKEQEKLIKKSITTVKTNDKLSKDKEASNKWLGFPYIFENSLGSEYEHIEEINYFSIAERELRPALERAKVVDNKLYTIILNNRKELFPIFDNFSSMQQWWTENAQSCIEKFRNIIVQYRQIGHDWGFNKQETDSLWQYCELNNFLIDCIQNNYSVSEETKKEIINTLLLPISTLDKK